MSEKQAVYCPELNGCAYSHIAHAELTKEQQQITEMSRYIAKMDDEALEMDAAVATLRQQVRDLRAALLAQRYRYRGKPTCWCVQYPTEGEGWQHSAGCLAAEAALAATAEPEAQP